MSIERIGVIGAGQMGNGIAHVLSLAGFDVVLDDINPRRSARRSSRIDKNMHRQAARGLIKDELIEPALKRIHTTQNARRHEGPRSRHRGRDRRRKRQAQDLPGSLPAHLATNDADRDQHLVDLGHAACGVDRPAGAFHRPAFHESGADDAAGGSDPRHRHRRHHVPGGARHRASASARRRPMPKISRPSSSTASCCR